MYPLSDIDDTYDSSGDIPREIFEEASVEASVDDMALSKTLNKEQQATCNEIMSVVSDHGGLFSVDGPATSKRLICTRPCSLLYVVRTRLSWQH